MKNFAETIKNPIVKAAKSCYNSPANFWQHAAILTISVYHIAQVAIVAMNKDTPKKEKAFLIPQEIIDGVINLATFVVFAQSFKTLGRKLVKNEKIIPHNRDKKIFSEEFATFANLAGSLFAVNIVSPIIRNKFGGDIQKAFMKKQEVKEQKTSDSPYQTYNPTYSPTPNPTYNPTFKAYSGRLKI